jgi:Zn-dependent protease with chaperone function
MFMHLLLVSTVVVSWLGPRVLNRLDLRRWDPLPLITCWLAGMAGIVFALLTCTVFQVVPHHVEVDGLDEATEHCPSEHDGEPPLLEALSGVVGALLLIGVGTRAIVLAVEAVRLHRRTRREYLTVLALAGRIDPGRPRTIWLSHDRPLAFSLADRPGTVVVTEGLAKRLAPDALAAAIAHERAHLAARHHLIIAVADVLRASLPFLSLFRQAPTTLRDLVEVAADQTAVRSHGRAALYAALDCATANDRPLAGLGVSGDAMALRMTRLREAAPTATRLRRTISCVTAGVLAGTAPFVLATCLALVVRTASC